MPLIYRSMKEENGKPVIGRAADALGIRVNTDIAPDNEGLVQPRTGGMSVAPSFRALPPLRVPKRLASIYDGPEGKNSLCIWRMGTGTFTEAAITPDLALRPDSPKHGLVEPARTMLLEEYEKALADTQNDWSLDESGA